MIYKYYYPADTEEKKAANKEFCELRDKLSKDGLSIHYDTFRCKDFFFSVRNIYYNKKIYVMKRCNKKCIEIVDLMQEYKNAVNEYKQVSQQ